MRDTSTPTEVDRDYRIEVRFGDAVLEAGHTAIPNLVLNHYAALNVSPGELVFVLICLQHKWTVRDPYPSLGTVAARMGVSRRQARNYAHGLRTKGLLVVSERVMPGKGQLSNTYDFGPLIRAVVEVENTERQAPRKFRSEGARKDPSYEEHEFQEDEFSSSKSANELLRSVGSRTEGHSRFAKPPRESFAEVGSRREAEPLSAILAARSSNGPLRQSLAALPARPVQFTAGSGQLEAGIAEISELIGDADNVRSNIVRARRLLAKSGLSESGFMVCVLRAHALLRERSRTGRRPVRRAGAYFFRIVEDLLDDATERRRAQSSEMVPRGSPPISDVERAT